MSECQPVSHRSGVIASVRHRKRSDQKPVFLTSALKGLVLRCINASHSMKATGLRLAAKTRGFRIRRMASITLPVKLLKDPGNCKRVTEAPHFTVGLRVMGIHSGVFVNCWLPRYFGFDYDLQSAAPVLDTVDDGLGQAADDGDSQPRLVRNHIERAAGAGRGLDHDLHAATLLRMRNGKVDDSIAGVALMKQHQ